VDLCIGSREEVWGERKGMGDGVRHTFLPGPKK
jgi:hypothetical protein